MGLVIAQVKLSKTTNSSLSDSSETVNRQDTTFIPREEEKTIVDLKQETIQVELPGKLLTRNVSAQNVLEALNEITAKEKYTVQKKESANGTVVEGIGQYQKTSTQSWKYWVNGKKGIIAPDRYIIHPGDKIIWKIE